MPEPSYASYLPSVLRGSPVLEALLSAFEGILLELEEKIDSHPELLHPARAPSEFLPWLAQWVATAIRNDWKIKDWTTVRNLIESLIPAYKLRGTREGIQEILRLSGEEGVTVYDFHSSQDCGGVGPLFDLDKDNPPPPHFFGVVVTPKSQNDYSYQRELRIRSIVDREKPAHTFYGLVTRTPAMRIINNPKTESDGIRIGSARLGVDVLVPPGPWAAPCVSLSGESGSGIFVPYDRIDLDGECTIEFWVKTDNPIDYEQTVFESTSVTIRVKASGDLSVWDRDVGIIETTTQPLASQEWTHVAVVLSPGPGESTTTTTLYCNGEAVNSGSFYRNNSPQDAYIGRGYDDSSAFAGQFCEFRVWKVILYAEDIESRRWIRLIDQDEVPWTELKAYLAMHDFDANGNGDLVGVGESVEGGYLFVDGGTALTNGGPKIATSDA